MKNIYIYCGLILILLINIFFTNKRLLTESVNNDLVFMHIPKTGGTTIEDIGKKNNYNFGKFDERLRKLSTQTCNFWHEPPDKLKTNIYKNNPSFTIVRNPYDRIISEYNYQCKIANRQPNAQELNKFIQINLHNNMESTKYDCHLLPQSRYIKIYSNGTSDIDHILKLENLKQDFDKLAVQYGLNFSINNKHNSTDNIKNRVTKEDLTSESIQLINIAYNDDFNNFGYVKQVY